MAFKLAGPQSDLMRNQALTDSTLSPECVCISKNGEHPGDQNHQDFLKSTAIQMGGVL